jgi:FG-GAP-like repeat
VLADLDGNGQADAIMGRENATGAFVMMGDPHGGFAPAQAVGSTHALELLAAGDVDGDGDLDIVGIDQDVGPFNTLLNLGGELSGFALSAQPAQQMSGLALGDMDGDDVLDGVLATGALGGVVLISHGTGTGTFTGPQFTAPLGYTNGLRLADVDGDGTLDPIVAWPDGVAYFPADGAGGLGAPRAVEVGGEATDVEVLDLQGDGTVDVVASVEVPPTFAANVLGVAINSGGGQFEDTVAYPLGFGFRALRAGDVVGDASIDVVALGWSQTLVAAFAGDGAGGLGAAQPSAIPTFSEAVALDDRNGDGKLDILVPAQEHLAELRSAAGAPGEPRCEVLTGSEPERPALGDLNGDGWPDAVVALRFSNQVNVLLGDGQGLLGAPAAYDAAVNPWDAALADLDADGDLDTVCGMAYPTRVVRLLNDGTGVLGPWATYVGNGSIYGTASLHLGDLNEDGHADAVACTSSDILVFRGTGLGGFLNGQATAAGGLALALDVAHLDGDGHLDVVVTGSSNPASRILHGSGHGGFGPPQFVVTSTAPWQYDIIAARLDGDDSYDLATVNLEADNVCVTRSDGAGGWLPPVPYTTLNEPRHLASADFDGDGQADIAVTSESPFSRTINLHLGLGAGALAAGVALFPGYQPHIVSPGDLDGDGLPEMVVGVRNSDLLTVLHNHGPPPWTPLGNGLAGSHGVPLLDGSGTLQAGAPVSLALSRAVESALSVLVAGTGTASVSFKGGVLVPAPQLLLAVPISAYGEFVLTGAWPAGLPSGTTIFLQDWVPDAAGPQGWSASGALEAHVP